MKTKERQAKSFHRQTERGAALVTTLLIATLLLGASLSLVMSTSLSSTTAIDSAAEMQAYSGAEAGIEATLNVLRGNVAPDASLAGTRMNFRNAARPNTSNNTSDPKRTGTGAEARLSGWLNYSYQNPAVTNDWRVPVTASYAPLNGIAFRITISDPDDPGPIATKRIMTEPTYNPERLLIHSEGFGPKGAVKRLEMIVRNSAFEFNPPATVTAIGGPGINFELGNSSSVEYSGIDNCGCPSPETSLASFAVSAGNLATAQSEVDSMGASQVTPSTVVNADTALPFLASGDAARTFLGVLRELAEKSPAGNRVFANQAAAGSLGTPTATKVTFIDNYGTGATPGPAVSLGPGPQGAGMLIITGELETNGTTDFDGIIFVLGRGKITRSGGGNGVLRGAFVVANFDPNGAAGSGFGAPTYSINGGGTSKVAYDSVALRRALELTGLSVIGVREHH